VINLNQVVFQIDHVNRPQEVKPTHVCGVRVKLAPHKDLEGAEANQGEKKSMDWDVVALEHQGQRLFSVRFADGLKGTFRVPPSFCSGVFAPLLDDDILAQATVADGVVTWPNGLDLAPDTMHQEIARSPDRHYEVGTRKHPPAAGAPSAQTRVSEDLPQ